MVLEAYQTKCLPSGNISPSKQLPHPLLGHNGPDKEKRGYSYLKISHGKP